jgi:hypothetical protein
MSPVLKGRSHRLRAAQPNSCKIAASSNSSALLGRLAGIRETQGVALGSGPSALKRPKPNVNSLPLSLEGYLTNFQLITLALDFGVNAADGVRHMRQTRV